MKSDFPLNRDMRLSFPLGLFCMITLSCSLVLALEQSMSVPNAPSLLPAPDESALTVHPQKGDPTSRVHHLADGLDDDVYWHDDEPDHHLHAGK